jgi:hypothetical protein
MVVCYSLPLLLAPRNHSCNPFLTASRTIFTMLSVWSLFSTIVCAGLVSQVALANPLPKAGKYAPQHAPGHLGAVASESSICSEIGIDLLKQGGNAADAVSSPAKIYTYFIFISNTNSSWVPPFVSASLVCTTAASEAGVSCWQEGRMVPTSSSTSVRRCQLQAFRTCTIIIRMQAYTAEWPGKCEVLGKAAAS